MNTNPDVSWTAIGAAPLHSQLSGVLAGVAFVGLTLVLTRQGGSGEGTSAETDDHLSLIAIGDLFIAFLTLCVAALEWGILCGEIDKSLVRPAAAAVLSTVTLSLGAMQMTAGIGYLVLMFQRKSQTPQLWDLYRTCYIGFMAVAILASPNMG
jgi:hypothetical protein